jgi:hypothetical protein
VLQLEHANSTLGTSRTDHPINSGWVRRCFGEAALRSVSGRSVICSGTIFGTPAGFASLARGYSATRCLRRADGIDQGVLNYLVHSHSELLGGTTVELQPRGQGAVNALQPFKLVPLGELRAHMSPEGIVLDDDGGPSAVVHQFDRLVPLGVQFGALQGYSLRCLDKKEAGCRTYARAG